MNTNAPVTFFRRFRRTPKRLRGIIAVLLSVGTASAGLQAQGPSGGIVRAGDAQITGEGTGSTRIDQQSARAVIDWRRFDIGPGGEVIFVQPSAQSATLNRVTGDQASMLLGRLDANGQILLINPNGIVFGAGSQVNVGSLIASTSNISNADFMAGRLVFGEPGRPGAGVLNAGSITARDSGLVALVAPHVRNDGVIVARLGKVVLGSADTFTVDLYGDALINLALSDANAGQLVDANGQPVSSLITNTGHIDTAGGQTVLMTARNAKNVLDSLINMSGTIKADTAVQQNGRILLLAEGGKVDVTGSLSSQGSSGGTIQVLGDQVHLGSSASLDASGAAGGGTVLVGGAFQGSGDIYRSTRTTIDAGATIKANATEDGNGGQVVVWSDGQTSFAGSVEAKGGTVGGGGRLEVSGKQALDFLGQADASATNGQSGSLLLDPAFMTIGAAEASSITRVLRTGTTATLQADVDINVNSAIFGGDREAGGGLAMSAGHDINVNDFIVTNDGAINMTATQGTVNVAAGKAVFAGSAPITVNAGGTIHTGPMLTNGALSIQSLAGAVAIDSFIDEHTGPVSIKAAGSVDINQPIVNMVNGSALDVSAGTDVNVNAQVDGRGGAAGGAVTMTAARDLNVNQAVVTNNGRMSLTATNGALNVASGTPLLSGTGATTLNAKGDITTGPVSAGSLAINSTASSVAVNGVIDAATGDTRISAGTDVAINDAVVNGQTGSALTVSAGRDITVNGQIDGRGGVAGGAVTLNATRNLNVAEHLLTNNGAVNLTATNGTVSVAAGKGTYAGAAPIAMRAGGDITTGFVSGASLSATSTGGSVRVNGVIDGSTGRVDLNAANDVRINAAVLSPRTGTSFNATAGHDVVVNAQIDGRGGATGGAVSLKASHDAALNSSVVTNNAAIGITATNGSAVMASGTSLVSGNAPITIAAGGDVVTRGISGGSLSATSGGGSVSIEGVIDGSTGRVDLAAGRDVNINAPVLNMRTGSPLNASAGQNINVNAQIDGTAGAAGGIVNLAAARDLNVNAAIATRDGAIQLSAANGTATFAPSATLFSGTGAISVDALGNITTPAVSGGSVNLNSRGGAVTVGGQLAGAGGPVTIAAAGQVDIAHAVTNPGSSALSITAGTDLNVNAAVGRTDAGIPSGPVTLLAGQNVTLNNSVVTENAAISVTAQNGTVTTAAGQGLYAGSGNITVQSGQDLTTGTTSTTGALTLRSTAGSVNVNTAISGATGAVTIAAANDVNVNQAIANPRTDAPLTISAGNDISVNARIDGRDDVLTGPSGTVTLASGHDIALNEDVVGVDTALSLTASGGTVAWGSGKALFAGAGPITVTAGGDLSTGATSTTGALSVTSTNGSVSVNSAIDATTGNVAIGAGQNVNINQAITNIKSGADLAVTAGADINVGAQVDGRGGAVAGGAVTMTAAHDLNLTKAIATNNGVVNLTATAGSIVVPVGTEVITAVPVGPGTRDEITTPMQAIVDTGSAPVTLTSGGDFTLASPINTTGALTITSTNGDVTTAAPIGDQTGAVTITAGDALIVNREVRTNDKDITLNAGAGGITINQINDYDYTMTSSVNPRNANLTFNSGGNVSILDADGVATTKTLTIDARGQLVTGLIGDAVSGGGRPEAVVLNADAGIGFFRTGYAGSVTATSSGGSITLSVSSPGKLRVTTGTPNTLDCPTCNINLSSGAFDTSIGPDVVLNAGGSVNMSDFQSTTVDLTARSGDVNLNQVLVQTFSATAGRDIVLNKTVYAGPSQASAGYPLTLTAGRDFIATVTSPIHAGGDMLTITAGRNLTMFLLETLGAVSFTATTGNITLNNDIGPHILNPGPAPDFNPGDLGVASLVIAAPAPGASITMQGARAQGNVTMTSGGDLSAAKEIVSVNGTVTLNVQGTQTLNQNVPIGSQQQMGGFGFASPVAPPGPKSPLPTAPGAASGGGPGVPAFAEIPVSFADQVVGGVIQPGAASGSASLPGLVNAAAAPGVRGGSTTRPVAPNGSTVGPVNGSSDPGTADTAAALRTAGQACGEDASSGDSNGLAAVTTATTEDAGGQQGSPSCPPAPDAGASAASATGPTSAPPAVPAGTDSQAQDAVRPTPLGGGLQ